MPKKSRRQRARAGKVPALDEAVRMLQEMENWDDPALMYFAQETHMENIATAVQCFLAKEDWHRAEIVLRGTMGRADWTNGMSDTMNLALCLQQQDKLDDAETVFQDAIDSAESLTDSTRASLHCNYGGFLINKREDKDAALEHIRAAVDLDPQNLHGLYNLGYVLEAIGTDINGAAEAYEAALRIDPSDDVARSRLSGLRQTHKPLLVDLPAAKRLLVEERHAEAMPILRKIVATSTSNVKLRAQNALAAALCGLGDLDAAEAVVREATNEFPADTNLRVNLGRMLGVRKQWAEAYTELRLATRLDPDNAEAHFGLAAALHELLDFVSADAEYKEALRCSEPLPFDVMEARGVSKLVANSLEGVSRTRVVLRAYQAIAARHDVPKHFFCPISLSIMHFPVMASDGCRYEKWHFQRWLDSSDPEKWRSPVTYEPMDAYLELDLELLKEIRGFLSSKVTDASVRDLASEAPVFGIRSLSL